MRPFFALFLICLFPWWLQASDPAPEFSTAGFFTADPAVRNAISLNIGWRFYRGTAAGAEAVGFDDAGWPVVNVPHSVMPVPLNGSGGINYQGEAWYRKRFTPPVPATPVRQFLHFEAVMGKSKLWVNGTLVHEQFGGYLPFHVDVTELLIPGQENVIALWCDNQNDPAYPPGKNQEQLDFTYAGGLYRDVYLVTTRPVYIPHPNEADQVAGGGLHVHFTEVSEAAATVQVAVAVRNTLAAQQDLQVTALLQTRDFSPVTTASAPLTLAAATDGTVRIALPVENPKLWTPDSPNLYQLIVEVTDRNGNRLDAWRSRIGIRTFSFRGKEGFFLNGKPFPGKLVGGNRHQDYAYIGNALPNATHWRDARLLRQAGMRVVRNAHYPQDPAFMDACDELGLFVIVNTPGWQFWNPAPLFRERVVQDIRHMVRRDRNHASVLMWEPILNETWYPDDFARQVHGVVKEELPFPPNVTASDHHAKGADAFDVIFAHPLEIPSKVPHLQDTPENRKAYAFDYTKEPRNVFIREWGDNVDNWNAHNSPSRVEKSWGEAAMLAQLKHYTLPDYLYTAWDTLHDTPRQHFGGALWHSFDHQRGYHPDPFWGGIFDATRQPKLSYYAFRAQLPVGTDIPHIDGGPFVYIAHEMTPFSPADITVLSNCEAVRLTVNGEDVGTLATHPQGTSMPHRPLVFKDAFDFMNVKSLHRQRKADQARIVAEGMINGEVVVRSVRRAALRRTRLTLEVADEGLPLRADGGDIVPVVARVTDDEGNIKRLSRDEIRFTVSGAGSMVDAPGMNPQETTWGEAVILVRASETPGLIRVTAEMLAPGSQQPAPATLEFETVPAVLPRLFSETPRAGTFMRSHGTDPEVEALQQELQETRKELQRLRLRDVEQQQDAFDTGSE